LHVFQGYNQRQALNSGSTVPLEDEYRCNQQVLQLETVRFW
jgi:hypothetical protein